MLLRERLKRWEMRHFLVFQPNHTTDLIVAERALGAHMFFRWLWSLVYNALFQTLPADWVIALVLPAVLRLLVNKTNLARIVAADKALLYFRVLSNVRAGLFRVWRSLHGFGRALTGDAYYHGTFADVSFRPSHTEPLGRQIRK